MSSGNVTFPDAGEPPSAYDFERTLLIGSYLGAMSWGIHFAVYGSAMYFSFVRLGDKRRGSNTLCWLFMAYMTVIFGLSTTYVGTNIQANIDGYITHRNDPGGPATFAQNNFRSAMVLVGNNIFPTISIWLNDMLMIWRLYVIWGVYWIVSLAVVAFLGSFVMGILLLFTSSQPGHTFNSADAVKFGTAFFSISLSLQVLITLVIVFRLIYLQRQTTKALGNTPEYRDHYISAWPILLESSAMYGTVGFIFLILYNKNNPVSNVFLQLMVQWMCISSDLIILRVMVGSGWTTRTAEKYTSMIFKTGNQESTAHVVSLEHNKRSGGSLMSDSDTKV
ncbi:hypothetical protein D9758_004893 [Tetrapyrgos nigripes]|uniref:Uncharacterized protein n=1 Tax=Tetrapyrgos nigripes TaxID=182062 RepID=A0A8H5G614_9AGAR|nr:hypothetical protein D9758_004893 [Tetrapyrgos nigripes]